MGMNPPTFFSPSCLRWSPLLLAVCPLVMPRGCKACRTECSIRRPQPKRCTGNSQKGSNFRAKAAQLSTLIPTPDYYSQSCPNSHLLLIGLLALLLGGLLLLVLALAASVPGEGLGKDGKDLLILDLLVGLELGEVERRGGAKLGEAVLGDGY